MSTFQIMNDNKLDLQSLCIVVIVTVCSYGLALILSITCWNAYKRHKSSDIICSKCCSSPSPQGFVQMNPYQYSGLPQYRYFLILICVFHMLKLKLF